jgi:RHS repeat-associated protein
MEPAQLQAFSEPPLAAMSQLKEKPRLGVPSKNPALHPGHNVCQSTTALGVSWSVASGTRQSDMMGRFLSPDWSAKEEPVPYAKLDDPQSLNLYAYVGNNPLSRVDKDGHSTLVYDGNSHTITLYDKNGNEIGHWEAHNNVAIHAPKGEGFQGHFTHGPIQNGTYSIRGADQKGGKQHVGEPANGPFGSKGIVHMNHAKSASGATVEDDGVHAGRQATSTHDQSESLTGGCIRTTPEAMGAIQTTAPKDPLQSITVTNNQQNVQQWQKQAKAAGDKIQ